MKTQEAMTLVLKLSSTGETLCEVPLDLKTTIYINSILEIDEETPEEEVSARWERFVLEALLEACSKAKELAVLQEQSNQKNFQQEGQEMNSYEIRWVINIDASTPHDAAVEALEIMRDHASIATVFQVEDSVGNITIVDLTDDLS